MLKPNKHMHPDQTVIYMSYVLLRHIKRVRTETYTKLVDIAKKSVVDGEFLFLPAINFLYLMGVIAYYAKNDSFEYLKQ